MTWKFVALIVLALHFSACSSIESSWRVEPIELVDSDSDIATISRTLKSGKLIFSRYIGYQHKTKKGPLLLPFFDSNFREFYASRPIVINVEFQPFQADALYQFKANNQTITVDGRKHNCSNHWLTPGPNQSNDDQSMLSGPQKFELTFGSTQLNQVEQFTLKFEISIQEKPESAQMKYQIDCETAEINLCELPLYFPPATH